MTESQPSQARARNRSAPLVSVAIVTYQHAAYVKQAVESVLAQDYPNLEVVISDDNSTDGTQHVLAGLQDDRLTLLTHEGDRSVARNVNRALERCTGEFVVLFDGDDYLLPGKLPRQVQYMLQNPRCNVCFHAAEAFDSASGQTVDLVGDPRQNDRLTASDLVAKGNFLPLCCLMFRASAMPADGVPAQLSYVADWILLVETTQGGTFEGVDGAYARYRRHPGGITNQRNLRSPVWRDALMTVDIVKRRHPELRSACRQGRAHVLSWEAFRRARGGAAITQIAPLLLRAMVSSGNLQLARPLAAFLRESLLGKRRLLPVPAADN